MYLLALLIFLATLVALSTKALLALWTGIFLLAGGFLAGQHLRPSGAPPASATPTGRSAAQASRRDTDPLYSLGGRWGSDSREAPR